MMMARARAILNPTHTPRAASRGIFNLRHRVRSLSQGIVTTLRWVIIEYALGVSYASEAICTPLNVEFTWRWIRKHYRQG